MVPSKRSVALILAAVLFFSPRGLLAQDPVAVKTQANQNVMNAKRLMEQADVLVKTKTTSAGLQTAASLYVRAGQLFENAAKVYQGLGPNYANEQEVANSYKATQYCASSAKRIQQYLQPAARPVPAK